MTLRQSILKTSGAAGPLHPNPRREFDKIYQKALSLGLEHKDLKKLESLEFIKTSHLPWNKILLVQVLFFLPLILFTVYVQQWPITNRHLAATLAYFSKKNLQSDTCLLKFDDNQVISAAFRQVDNCDFCRGVESEDRVSNLSPDVFESKYVATKRPLVVVDAAHNWTAMQTFNFRFFQKIYVDENRKNCWYHPYKSGFKTLKEALEMSNERASMAPGEKPWYFGWSNCDSVAANEFRKHYTRPYFLPNSTEMSKTDWFFMGSSGYGANLHVDNVKALSWQAQIVGTKVWTIRAPFECAYQCPKAQNIKIKVHPGEVIVLDTDYWYHSTKIVSTEPSICIGSEFA